MATTTMVHVRVDEHVKAQAAETLAAMGLSISDAVRVFLTRIAAEKQLPFALKVPNAETRAAMEEARAMSRARQAHLLRNAPEEKEALNFIEAVADFDP
jgi:DNA-damage-inducible protein J